MESEGRSAFRTAFKLLVLLKLQASPKLSAYRRRALITR